MESVLTKKVTKDKDWIGAHLIKKEWGGEDNMWNVVCWPKKTELAWGEHFEEPIDTAFTNRRERKIDISINVEKEDELISPKDAGTKISEAVNKIPKDAQRYATWVTAVEEQGTSAMWEANRGHSKRILRGERFFQAWQCHLGRD